MQLDQRSKLGLVVLKVEPSELIPVNNSVQSANRNVDDPHICLVTTPKLYAICVLKTDDVDLPVLFVFVFVAGDLLGFEDDEVLVGLLNLEDFVGLIVNLIGVLQLLLAQFAVESLPSVRGHELSKLPVFCS